MGKSAYRLVDWFLTRGEWEDICEKVQKQIDKLEDDDDIAYIGRTNDPDAREEEHEEDWDATKLKVVYKSDVQKEIALLEEALILEFWDDIDNETQDSRGPWGAPPYFVYVAIRLEGKR